MARVNDTTEQRFNKISIGLASPESILGASRGEVLKPETINYRTHKPERDGLFCERIFGPIKDYECACGKYKRIRYRGIVCDRCGVEVTEKKVRRDRVGHISLVVPVAHIWYFRSLPNKLGYLLGLPSKKLDMIIYYERYVVIQPGIAKGPEGEELQMLDFLTEEEYLNIIDELPQENQYLEDSDPNKFIAKMGAECLIELLQRIDLEALSYELRHKANTETSKQRKTEALKRLQVVESFRESQANRENKPEWMIMKVVPVIPPELRPLVPLDGGRFATSDLNDLYRRVIIRNNRLKRLMEIKAPEVILRNEKRMLQEAVDSLFDNTRKASAVKTESNRPLKSLSDSLKGKQGRFRQNLLGKRVDYSARSVIVVGPDLKLFECGLPKDMAAELYKPFIIRKLIERGIVKTVKSAKKIIDKKEPVVWDILENVIKGHPVLLNRAPTLHRLGIQAFQPKLIEGKAIRLHPLACTAFNADFDGDQMAVHLPLGPEAILEAQLLMLASQNILNPANGSPITVPSQDMVLGLYYMTKERRSTPEVPVQGEGLTFYSPEEVVIAFNEKRVNLNAAIKIRVKDFNEAGELVPQIIETTVGRVLFNNVVPEEAGFINQVLNKKALRDIIGRILELTDVPKTAEFLDRIKQMGYEFAFKGGLSFSLGDIIIPAEKIKMIEEANTQVDGIIGNYNMGLITNNERYNQVIDVWTSTNAMLTELAMKRIREDQQGFNSVYMMLDSGARGSKEQIRQLTGMRGLMAKPSGEIIETPIISNFKEGLTVLEYFNSTHGARKGLSDTALKTANSGYLTRRLVDVAQDCIVREVDCGTDRAITAEAAVNDGEVVASLAERVLGRVSADDVLRPGTDEVVVKAGELIDERKADMIEAAGVQKMRIRSPLTCESDDGVCANCYGRDLARGTRVNIGEAVGIIAAQSIGEPGTQLTMRTFHIGGVAQGGQQSFLEASANGKVEFRNANILENAAGEQIALGRNMVLAIIDENGEERAQHKIGYGTKIHVKDGATIARGDKMFEWDPYTLPIIAEKGGKVRFVDLVSGISVREETDDATGMTQKIVSDWRSVPRGGDLKPEIIVVGADGEPVRKEDGNPVTYPMSVDAILSIEDGQDVAAGDVVARIPREGAKTKDITGGLPRVAELFEARRPKDHAIIAEIDGYVRFGKDYKNKRRIAIESADDPDHKVEYMVPKGKHIPVQEGDFVQKGDYIMDGNPAPHDILAIMGVEALADYMIDEVQDVYRLQGVKINDKHIEVIVRQMLQKWEISDSGDTTLLKGETVDKVEFDEANAKAEARGGRPAQGEPILLGITKASLQTRSFISAASFQETTRVLTEASVQGKRDKLVGLKENVIVGRLIPAGTGGATAIVRSIAAKRDNVVLEARREEAEEAVKLAAPSYDDIAVETPESREE